MAQTYNPYRYSAEMKWNGGSGEIIDISPTSISNVIIDYDYDKKNMPIIFLSCNISKDLLDKMITQKADSTIIFTLQKYKLKDSLDTNVTMKTDYIKDEFIYFIQDDVNYKKDVEYDTKNEMDQPDGIFAKVMIGLMKLKLINDNKQTINAIYRGASKTDVVLINTRHMPLLMEPLDKDKVFDELIMPPISSISKLLSYIDSKFLIYSTPYRYFLDFDRTYLLSSSGKTIQANDEVVKNIIINIDNPSSKDGKIQGVNVDASTHTLEVDAIFTRYSLDTKTDNLFNNIIAIDSEGNTLSEDVNSVKSKGSTKKADIIRVENLEKVQQLKKKIELSGVMVRIVKNDIDCSMFTINKSFHINNFKEHTEHNGQFLLAGKKEVFVKERDNFKLNTMLLFRKIT